jgi:copper(I)-binding protein
VIRSGRGGSQPRRMLVAAAAALVPAVLALAGCEAGNNPPSAMWHQPTDGTTTTPANGDITVIGAFVLGAPLGGELQPGQDAGLFFGLSDAGAPDTLIRVSAPGLASSVVLPGGQVHVGGRPVLLTGPQPSVVLMNLLRPVGGGSVVKLVLTFQNAGSFIVRVPVMPQAQYYASFSPAPSPSATASSHPSAFPSPRRSH